MSFPATVVPSVVNGQLTDLAEIERLDEQLQQLYANRLVVQPMLTRSLVSFQANKARPVYRWYKYKEAFSAALVEYFLQRFQITHGTVLDPFAGSGTTLFAASASGLDAHGIELLPIGQQIIATKKLLDSGLEGADLARLEYWANERPWEQTDERVPLPELRITRGAYPPETHEAIERYLGACQQEQPHVQAVLRFALLCVLESVSYTRKDGQYLRWDDRSGRRVGHKPFDKGVIVEFTQAIHDKLSEIMADLAPTTAQLELFATRRPQGEIVLFNGSCLSVMPSLPSGAYDVIITSPPYCNRYDYTRTYALELALLGIDEQQLSSLRQEMLSCTVENRPKDLLKINPSWSGAIAATDRQELLQAILAYLEKQRARGVLNNNGIPRMVRGYFYEMACVIAECARVLKSGAPLVMVNDNVRYAGAAISVDMILSWIAEQLGFTTEQILVLPDNKGNSSQQMGEHGRKPLRKCVYVWRRL